MTRIVNTLFYASPNANGVRRPQKTNTITEPVTDPDTGETTEEPVPDVPVVTPPDPTDPTDPGEGTGGDIGNPTGNSTITLGAVPNITRRINGTVYNSPQDVAASAGQTITITYIADGDCTLLPKMSYEDDVVTYSANGREMTQSWTIPNDEPGDSWWFGVEVWRYGGDTVEAYAVHYDRVHIAKSLSDVVTASTTRTILDEMKSKLTVAGRTLVVPNGTRSSFRDVINVGWGHGTNETTTEVRNGNHTFRNLYQDPFNGGRVTGQTADVSKYTVIMSETPCGVFLNRNRQQNSAINFTGNIPIIDGRSNQDGYRSTIGIKAKGFLVKNSGASAEYVTPIRTYRALSCSIDACYFLEDMTLNNDGWYGDGSCTTHHGSENCSMTYGGGIGNSRLMNMQAGNSYNCTHSRFIATNGCTQLAYNFRCQTFTSYPTNNAWYRNCLALDGFLFYQGARHTSGTEPILNYCFNETNGDNNRVVHEACVMFNDVRGFSQTNNAGNDYGERDQFIDCVGFLSRRDTRNLNEKNFELMRGGPIEITRCTMGRNEAFEFSQQPILTRAQANSNYTSRINAMFINQPNWNIGAQHQVIRDSAGEYSQLNNIGLAGSAYPMNSSIRNNTTGFFTYTEANTQTSGFKYWFRAEEGSDLAQRDAAARDVFCARGRYGIEPTSQRAGFTTVYNGRNGNKYVNWITRSPWYELRNFYATYDCTSRGNRYRGNQGWAAPGVHPVDYLLRRGTTPSQAINTPYIEDIYAHDGASSGEVWLSWRPICPAYRSTITGYDIYIDNRLVATNVDKRTTTFKFQNINSGTRQFNVVVKDNTYGDSGRSRTITHVVS